MTATFCPSLPKFLQWGVLGAKVQNLASSHPHFQHGATHPSYKTNLGPVEDGPSQPGDTFLSWSEGCFYTKMVQTQTEPANVIHPITNPVQPRVSTYTALDDQPHCRLCVFANCRCDLTVYLHTLHSSANWIKPLPSQLKLVLTYWPWRDGRLSWLVTYRDKCPAPGTEPGKVTQLSTNRAQCRLTSSIKINMLPLCQGLCTSVTR